MKVIILVTEQDKRNLQDKPKNLKDKQEKIWNKYDKTQIKYLNNANM